MKIIFRTLLAMLTLTSCHTKTENQPQNTPEIFLTNYGKIDDKNLKLKFGELIEFEINDQKINAVVLDIKQESNENWFGICFLNNNLLFGRKIPQGIGGNCIYLYDLSFVNEKALNNYKILEKLKIDFTKVGFGSDSPVINQEQILRDYKYGIEQRKKKETPCEKKLELLDPTNECYFELNEIQ